MEYEVEKILNKWGESQELKGKNQRYDLIKLHTLCVYQFILKICYVVQRVNLLKFIGLYFILLLYYNL